MELLITGICFGVLALIGRMWYCERRDDRKLHVARVRSMVRAARRRGETRGRAAEQNRIAVRAQQIERVLFERAMNN